ncbi:unnamed protein product [Lampetra fluviatilis]
MRNHVDLTKRKFVRRFVFSNIMEQGGDTHMEVEHAVDPFAVDPEPNRRIMDINLQLEDSVPLTINDNQEPTSSTNQHRTAFPYGADRDPGEVANLLMYEDVETLEANTAAAQAAIQQRHVSGVEGTAGLSRRRPWRFRTYAALGEASGQSRPRPHDTRSARSTRAGVLLETAPAATAAAATRRSTRTGGGVGSGAARTHHEVSSNLLASFFRAQGATLMQRDVQIVLGSARANGGDDDSSDSASDPGNQELIELSGSDVDPYDESTEEAETASIVDSGDLDVLSEDGHENEEQLPSANNDPTAAPPSDLQAGGPVAGSAGLGAGTSAGEGLGAGTSAGEGAGAGAVLPSSCKLPTAASPGEEEHDLCPVCFEAWTNAGSHRLCTLRCGHLFGYSCIDKWLRGQGGRCPQCNKKAKRSEVVVLYAKSIKSVDTSEEERLKSELATQQVQRRKAELESAQCRLQMQVVSEEYRKLKHQLQELRSTLSQYGAGSSCTPSSQGEGSGAVGTSRIYNFTKGLTVSAGGGCRVMAFSSAQGCLVASQPSPHASFMPGFGVKKISGGDLKSTQYVPIHSNQIRGLSFSSHGDSLLLSASLDNTVRITSLTSNTVVQTYQAGKPVWSCCWCGDEQMYLFAGLLNGTILVYDMRDTRTHVQELPPHGARCPVASLSYIPHGGASPLAALPMGGLLAGTLEGGCFWERRPGGSFVPHALSAEPGGGCIDVQCEPHSRHCLVTYRPGRTQTSVRCVLLELDSVPEPGDPARVRVACNPVQTFHTGSTCKLLNKNAIFPSPAHDGSLLVCTGDEASNCAMVWKSTTGSLLQKLPAQQPVLDICPFQMNQHNYLATLTEKMVKLYQWG